MSFSTFLFSLPWGRIRMHKGQEALTSLKYSREMELGTLYWSLTTRGFLICRKGQGAPSNHPSAQPSPL